MPFDIKDFQIPLAFAFDNTEELFPRVTDRNPIRNKKQMFTEFAIYHIKEPLFQLLEVNTSFDHLDYNFFAEQFSKVSKNLITGH